MKTSRKILVTLALAAVAGVLGTLAIAYLKTTLPDLPPRLGSLILGLGIYGAASVFLATVTVMLHDGGHKVLAALFAVMCTIECYIFIDVLARMWHYYNP